MVRALAIALALAVGYGAVMTYQVAAERRDHADTRAAHAEQLAGLERAAREAEKSARAEERRRVKALEGIIHDAETRLGQALADAAAATDAGDRLRQRVAELASACRGAPGDPAASAPGTPARSAADLLADVQRRLDEAADGIARHADRARSAGLACQKAHGSLTP
jgi:hypothetical protein